MTVRQRGTRRQWQHQPQELVRINERHWLAQDLVFAHSGHCAFVYGEPVAPTATDALNGAVTAGTGADALDGILGWVPDGSNKIYYALPASLPLPLTISAWWHGTDSTTNDGIVGVGRSAGYGGALLRRSSTEVVSARQEDTAGVATAVAATGGYASGRWQHGVGVFASNTSRFAYADSGNSAQNTGSRTHPSDCDRIVIAADFVSATPATTAIGSIALPLVIARELNATEVQRLYDEQLANPWGLFAGPPIWIPVSAPAAFKAAWAARQARSIGAGVI